MANHEYFIDEDSKRRCEDTKGTIVNAVDIPPVFSPEKGEIIRVTQQDIEKSERRFCFLSVDDDDTSTTVVLIEDGSKYLTSELGSVVFSDNLFPVSLTWKTRSGDLVAVVGIFYGKEALFRYDGIKWSTVGPSATITINTDAERNSSVYRTSYNHFNFTEACKCSIHDGMVFYYDFGIDWLVNALDFRSTVIDEK